ncbi:cytochrome P450 [Infundibulicybe gibba]|nr:cytochrome P450 [Infundibulicybe gibba]
MNSVMILSLVILAAGFIRRCYLRLTKTRGGFPLPPGPKPKHFVGNALEIPTQTAWLTYIKWAEIYQSEILHAEAFGQHIIILNSLEDATEIMERRAAKYSSRPAVPMLELMDWVDFNVALLPHGDMWRRHRRLFQQSFKKDAAVLVAAAVIMAIVYGHNVSTMNDKYVLIAEEAIDCAGKALLPGAAFVNAIPVLHIFPLVPGSEFSSRDGTGVPSLLRNLLEAKTPMRSENNVDPQTVASIATFFYAMATNPDVQLKAQNEIDAAVGNDRLPAPGDRPSLPYVEALYREVMRWRPAFPLGVPHASTEDDVYKGFFIPKGSIVLANICQGKLSEDDAILAFGFGRRVLATLNITKAKDPQGNDIEIDGKYTDGVISHPQPFPCSITPRSPKLLGREDRRILRSKELVCGHEGIDGNEWADDIAKEASQLGSSPSEDLPARIEMNKRGGPSSRNLHALLTDKALIPWAYQFIDASKRLRSVFGKITPPKFEEEKE